MTKQKFIYPIAYYMSYDKQKTLQKRQLPYVAFIFFANFRNNVFDLQYKQRLRKLRQLTLDDLQVPLDGNPHQSARELAQRCPLREMGKDQKASKRFPHKLYTKNVEKVKASTLQRSLRKSRTWMESSTPPRTQPWHCSFGIPPFPIHWTPPAGRAFKDVGGSEEMHWRPHQPEATVVLPRRNPPVAR